MMKACLEHRKVASEEFLFKCGQRIFCFGVKGVEKINAYLEPPYLEGIQRFFYLSSSICSIIHNIYKLTSSLQTVSSALSHFILGGK